MFSSMKGLFRVMASQSDWSPDFGLATPNPLFSFSWAIQRWTRWLCLGSLSCCITQVCLSLRSQTDGWTFSFRIFWWSAELMVPSIMSSHPDPEAAKQPQTITLPPPCLTVGMMFILGNAVLVYARCNGSTFVSSVHRIFTQKSCG